MRRAGRAESSTTATTGVVPARRASSLRPGRHNQFQDGEHQKHRDGGPAVEPESPDPEQRQHGQPAGVPQRGLATRRVFDSGPHPQAQQPDAHDDVPERDCGVDALVEGPPGPRCQGEYTGHLDERSEPIRHVIAVLGRSEPREAHPCPPDRE